MSRAAEVQLPGHRSTRNGELRGEVGGQAGDLRLCEGERVAARARVRRGVRERRLAVGEKARQTRDVDLVRAAVFVRRGVGFRCSAARRHLLGHLLRHREAVGKVREAVKRVEGQRHGRACVGQEVHEVIRTNGVWLAFRARDAVEVDDLRRVGNLEKPEVEIVRRRRAATIGERVVCRGLDAAADALALDLAHHARLDLVALARHPAHRCRHRIIRRRDCKARPRGCCGCEAGGKLAEDGRRVANALGVDAVHVRADSAERLAPDVELELVARALHVNGVRVDKNEFEDVGEVCI